MASTSGARRLEAHGAAVEGSVSVGRFWGRLGAAFHRCLLPVVWFALVGATAGLAGHPPGGQPRITLTRNAMYPPPINTVGVALGDIVQLDGVDFTPTTTGMPPSMFHFQRFDSSNRTVWVTAPTMSRSANRILFQNTVIDTPSDPLSPGYRAVPSFGHPSTYSHFSFGGGLRTYCQIYPACSQTLRAFPESPSFLHDQFPMWNDDGTEARVYRVGEKINLYGRYLNQGPVRVIFSRFGGTTGPFHIIEDPPSSHRLIRFTIPPQVPVGFDGKTHMRITVNGTTYLQFRQPVQAGQGAYCVAEITEPIFSEPVLTVDGPLDFEGRIQAYQTTTGPLRWRAVNRSTLTTTEIGTGTSLTVNPFAYGTTGDEIEVQAYLDDAPGGVVCSQDVRVLRLGEGPACTLAINGPATAAPEDPATYEVAGDFPEGSEFIWEVEGQQVSTLATATILFGELGYSDEEVHVSVRTTDATCPVFEAHVDVLPLPSCSLGTVQLSTGPPVYPELPLTLATTLSDPVRVVASEIEWTLRPADGSAAPVVVGDGLEATIDGTSLPSHLLGVLVEARAAVPSGLTTPPDACAASVTFVLEQLEDCTLDPLQVPDAPIYPEEDQTFSVTFSDSSRVDAGQVQWEASAGSQTVALGNGLQVSTNFLALGPEFVEASVSVSATVVSSLTGQVLCQRSRNITVEAEESCTLSAIQAPSGAVDPDAVSALQVVLDGNRVEPEHITWTAVSQKDGTQAVLGTGLQTVFRPLDLGASFVATIVQIRAEARGAGGSGPVLCQQEVLLQVDPYCDLTLQDPGSGPFPPEDPVTIDANLGGIGVLADDLQWVVQAQRTGATRTYQGIGTRLNLTPSSLGVDFTDTELVIRAFLPHPTSPGAELCGAVLSLQVLPEESCTLDGIDVPEGNLPPDAATDLQASFSGVRIEAEHLVWTATTSNGALRTVTLGTGNPVEFHPLDPAGPMGPDFVSADVTLRVRGISPISGQELCVFERVVRVDPFAAVAIEPVGSGPFFPEVPLSLSATFEGIGVPAASIDWIVSSQRTGQTTAFGSNVLAVLDVSGDLGPDFADTALLIETVVPHPTSGLPAVATSQISIFMEPEEQCEIDELVGPSDFLTPGEDNELQVTFTGSRVEPDDITWTATPAQGSLTVSFEGDVAASFDPLTLDPSIRNAFINTDVVIRAQVESQVTTGQVLCEAEETFTVDPYCSLALTIAGTQPFFPEDPLELSAQFDPIGPVVEDVVWTLSSPTTDTVHVFQNLEDLNLSLTLETFEPAFTGTDLIIQVAVPHPRVPDTFTCVAEETIEVRPICDLTITGAPTEEIQPDESFSLTVQVPEGTEASGDLVWTIDEVPGFSHQGATFTEVPGRLRDENGVGLNGRTLTIRVQDSGERCEGAAVEVVVAPFKCEVSIIQPADYMTVPGPDFDVSGTVSYNIPAPLPGEDPLGEILWARSTVPNGRVVDFGSGDSATLDLKGLADFAIDITGRFEGPSYAPVTCFDSQRITYRLRDASKAPQPDSGSPPAASAKDGGGPLDQETAECEAPLPEGCPTSNSAHAATAGSTVKGQKSTAGDPVDIPSGRLLERVVDVTVPSIGDNFQALRSYDSGRADEERNGAGWFGYGWRFGYEATLTRIGDEYHLRDPSFALHVFEPDPAGGYLPDVTSLARLVLRPDGHFGVLYAGGTEYCFDPSNGRLVAIEDLNDNRFVFTHHSSGVLATVTDPSGRTYSFQEDGNGHIESMTLPDTTTWTYGYQGDELAWVEDPLGNRIEYEYGPEHRMTRKVDPAGNEVRWTWSGDKVSTVTGEAGGVTAFSYATASRQTTVTAPDGGTTTHHYDQYGRIYRSVHPDGGVTEIDWDPTGTRLIKAHRDEAGRQISYDHDDRGNEISRTDPDGGNIALLRPPDTVVSILVASRTEEDGTQSSATSDAVGNAASVTNSEGETTRWDRNSRGQVTRIHGPDGGVTTFVYDQYGNRIQTIDPLGNVTEVDYDILSRPIRIRDPLGNETRLTYLLHDLVTETTDALGNIRRTLYDELLRPVQQVDVDGATTQTDYTVIQGQNRPVRVVDALGNETLFSYDSVGRLIETVDPRGAVSRTIYDQRGRPVQQIDALGGTITNTFDPDGRLVRTVDEVGNTTEFEYDTQGRLSRTTDALGNSTATVYDARGQVALSVDASGVPTFFERDDTGRVIRVGDAFGNTVETVYDGAGRISQTIDPRGNATLFQYDLLGRQTQVTDPLGQSSQTTFDAAGRVVEEIDALGRRVVYQHDALGRVTQVTAPDGATVQTAYNPDGTVATRTDPNGRITRFSYDALDRILESTDPAGHKIRQAYDPAGNRVLLVDENGNENTFDFDLLGRLTAVLDAQGKRVEHSYDAAGRRTATTNSRGQVVSFSYDPLGRLTQKTRPDGVDLFSYDPAGRRTSANNEHLSKTWEYDIAGRLAAIRDSRGFQREFTLDEAGNAVQELDTQGRTTARVFDPLDRVTNLTGPRGRTFAFSYDPISRPTAVQRPGGVSSSWAYDLAGRVESVFHRDPSGSVLAAFEYLYDPAGNRLSDIEYRPGQSWTTSYEFDIRDQLIGAQVSGNHQDHRDKGFGDLRYLYDPAGNRLEREQDGVLQVSTYDDLNQLATLNGELVEHDADGNMLTEPQSDGRFRRYVYDAENRLIETWEEVDPGPPANPGPGNSNGNNNQSGANGNAGGNGKGKGRGGNNSGDAGGGPPQDAGPPEDSGSSDTRRSLRRYFYDPDGQKIRVETYAQNQETLVETEDRFWVGDQVVEDRVQTPGGGGTVTSTYVRGPSGQLLLELLDDTTGAAADDVQYLTDTLGSTVGVFSADGGPVTRLAYLPYGGVVDGPEAVPFTFTGLRDEDVDGELGELLSAQFRHARPGIGRWVRRDPAGAVDGPNRHRWVANNPLRFTDPNGLFIVEGILGGLIDAGVTAASGKRDFNSLKTALIRGAVTGAIGAKVQAAYKISSALRAAALGAGLGGVAQLTTDVVEGNCFRASNYLLAVGGGGLLGGLFYKGGGALQGLFGSGADDLAREATDVIADTNILVNRRHLRSALESLADNEQLVITEQIRREIPRAFAQAGSNPLSAADFASLPVRPDVFSLGDIARFRNLARRLLSPAEFERAAAGLTGDAIIGSTAINTGTRVLSQDNAFIRLLRLLGGKGAQVGQ